MTDTLKELYQDIQAMRFGQGCEGYIPDDEAKQVFIELGTALVLAEAEKYFGSQQDLK